MTKKKLVNQKSDNIKTKDIPKSIKDNNKNTEKKKMPKKKKIILIIVITILLGIFIYSTVNIILWKIDSSKTETQLDGVDTSIQEIDDNENTEIITQEENIDKENPYWDYIKMKLINVDFKELKQKNNQTVGWIQVNGTNINYPFVQTKDNEFYLNHSYDKSYNNAGWVFLDYRNNIKDLGKNTIIYAHGRLDGAMFGSLKNILKSSWVKNTNNYVIKMSTEKENTLWQVFSVYRIPTTNDYIQVDFSSNKEFKELTNTLLGRSQFNFNTNVSENDKIITLSTCYDKQDKVVLHAKLIKKEKR